MKVSCPKCKKKFEYYDSKSRPFCTERCKMIDLGHWLDESYTISTKGDAMDDDLAHELEYEKNKEGE